GGISSSQSSSGSAAWAVEASARQQSSETMNGRMAATWKMNGAAERPRGESVLAAGHHAVDHQQDDRTDHGADKARALAGLVQAERLAAVGGQQRAADTQQDGHDPAHAVVAGFEETRDEADDQAD